MSHQGLLWLRVVAVAAATATASAAATIFRYFVIFCVFNFYSNGAMKIS
jgi:hypothetical protein